MLRITSHIERLLFLHDCVVLPGLGGFVLQSMPAHYQPETHSFSPMRKGIAFNPSLTHTDGLLESSYVQQYGVEYRQAQNMVQEDVDSLKRMLHRIGKVSLGKLGSFTKGESAFPIFHPAKTTLFDVDYYGLSPFYFPQLPAMEPLVELTPTEKPRKKNVYYLPIHRRLVQTVAISAAAIAFFLLISTPVREVSPSVNMAGILPTERFVRLTEAETAVVATPETVEEEPVVIEDTAPQVVDIEEEIQKEEPLLVPEPKVVAAPKTETPTVNIVPSQTDRKMYYIIIGSFPNQEQAAQFVNSSKFKKGEMGIIERDNRWRVYAQHFPDREGAETYLANLRQDDRYKSAWLLITR